MARRRRIDDMMPEIPEGPTSVFGPGEDNIVPGEVIVTLQADSMAEMAVSLPKVPLRGGIAAVGTTAFGVSALDKVLTKLDVESVTQLHGPSPTNVVNGLVMASDVGLDGTMRVRYRGGDDPQAVVESLNALDEVVWAEPSRWREASVTPNDPQFASQWGLTRIGCPAAWDVTTGDPSIVVAIVDTGIDLNHPELAPLTVAGQDLVDFPPGSIPRPGWVFEGDFTGVDGIPQDEVGHGTHVAGTVSSLSNNGVGVAGVAWNVRIMPVKVLARIRQTATNRVSGAGSSANIAAGIRWAADNGARVINLSLGGYTETRVEREAIAYAISQGVVVVAAMGNDDTDDPSFPAAFPNVIAVGATTSSDSRASFSNFGPHIDIAAPGVGIQSTYWDDTYASLNGTSMASPHVAGVAALVLSRNSTLTAAQVGNILRTTALALRDNPADPVPNDNYGHGLVQAAAAVNAASPVMPRSLRCPPRSLVMTTCPSQTVLCQPSIIAGSCPTRTIRCQPSVLTVCPTQTVTCQPSMLTVCPTRTIRCQPSVLTVCPSQTIRCQPSVAVICPTEAVICQVSNGPGCNPVSLADCPSFPCPNSLGCGGGGRFGAEEFDDEAQWDEYDPYGYDPYGTQY